MAGKIEVLTAVLGLLTLVSSESDDTVYIMEHDLGLGSFSNRGTINLPAAKRKDAEASVSQEELNADEISSISDPNSHGFYRVKINSLTNVNDNSTLVMGFSCMEEMKSASLNDVIDVYSDEVGNVVGVTVRPLRLSGAIETKHYTEFDTVLESHTPSPAPVPDTAGFLEKLREEKIQKEKEDKDPKSFIGKYWMYLLPVVFFMFMSNAQQQAA